MAGDPGTSAARRRSADGLALGVLIGAGVGGVAAFPAAVRGWGEVQTQGWLDAGLTRLVALALSSAVTTAVVPLFTGAALGVLVGWFVRPPGGHPARPDHRAWRSLHVVSVVLLVAAAGAEATRRTLLGRSAAGRPHVVWIVIDSLRADHLGCYGYPRNTSPFLDGLASRSTRFASALSQESYTLASVASYFTSRYPPETGVLYTAPHLDALGAPLVTLAEVLQDAGYATGGFVSNPHLWTRYQFDQGFDVYDDSYPRIGDGRITEAMALWEGKDTTGPMHAKLQRFLEHDRDAGSDRPVLLYLHYQDVHGPYIPPPDYQQMFLPDDVGPELRDYLARYFNRPIGRHDEAADPPIAPADKPNWPFNVAGMGITVAQYDGTIRHTDDALGRLFELLAAHGIDEHNAVVVVSADHGEEFHDPHPGDRLDVGHGRSLHREQIHVPLIISAPHMPAGQVVATAVELVDLAPTILDAVGLAERTPSAFVGRSLMPAVGGDALAQRPVHAGGNHGRGLVLADGLVYYRHDGDCKSRRHSHGKRPPENAAPVMRQELFTADDFGQTVELLRGAAGDGHPRLRRLQQLLDAWLARGGMGPGQAVDLDDEALQALREAGYLVGDD